MTGPTHDVFYGGGRDGQRWELDGNIGETGRVADPAGGVYARQPDFDTETDRAWFHLPSDAPTAANGVHVEPQQGAKFLCLQDIRTLLAVADRMGHADTATVYGRVSWTGKVTMLGLKPGVTDSLEPGRML